MQMIVAVDRNWGIGSKGKLLVSIPSDMKFFREETMGKTIVMGRKTLESFPGQKPLQGRRNIVLTKDLNYAVDGAEVCHSLEEVQMLIADTPKDDVYCIGGAQIYQQCLALCDTAHVTKIDHVYQADAYFPNLDELPEWKIAASSEELTYFDLDFQFLKYQKQ